MQKPVIIDAKRHTILFSEHTQRSGFGCGQVTLKNDEHMKLNGLYSLSDKTNPVVTGTFISVIEGSGFIHVNGLEKDFSSKDSICVKVTSWENAFLMTRKKTKLLVIEKLHIKPNAKSSIEISNHGCPLLKCRYENDHIDIWRDGDAVSNSIKVTRQITKASHHAFPPHGHIEGWEYGYVVNGKGFIDYKKIRKKLAIHKGCFFCMPTGDAGFHRISASPYEDLEVLCFANVPASGMCYYESGTKMVTSSDPQLCDFSCRFFIPNKQGLYRREEINNFQDFCSKYYKLVYANGYIA